LDWFDLCCSHISVGFVMDVQAWDRAWSDAPRQLDKPTAAS
jgi:hypothetical protein